MRGMHLWNDIFLVLVITIQGEVSKDQEENKKVKGQCDDYVLQC